MAFSARVLNAPAQQARRSLHDMRRAESQQDAAASPKGRGDTLPGNENDLLKLGNQYEEAGNFEEAERCYTAAALQYGSPEGFMELGLLYILTDAPTNTGRQSQQDEAMELIAEAERLGNEVAARFLRDHGARRDKGRTESNPSQETDETINPLCYDTIMDCVEITEGGRETAEGACRTFVERYLREKGERCSPKELEIRTAKVVEAVDGPLPRPKSWEELRELIPDIRSWSEYKAANPEKTIVDYLSDPDGLGKWTLAYPGLPRPALQYLYPVIDPDRPLIGSPHKALENWINREKKKTGGQNPLPPSLHVPVESTEIDRLAEQDLPPSERPYHVEKALRQRKWRADRSAT